MSQFIPQSLLIGTSDTTSYASNSSSLDNSSTRPKRPRRHLFAKLVRSAALAAGEELLASWLAKDPNKHGHYTTRRVPKMALYGAFVKTPLTYFLLNRLRALFKGRETRNAKVLQILAAMLLVAPIQKVVHLLSIAFITGARSFKHFKASVQACFRPAMAVILLAAVITVPFAQLFVPEALWPKFFALISLVVDTYANTVLKKKRLAALRRLHFGNDVNGPRQADSSERN